MTPAQIAHYKVTSKLGEGGMGAVYRATDTKLNRDVAIKVLPPAFAEDAGRMQRFDREAQLLASLNHPNIAQIYGIEAGAIVMELVEGTDLAGPLPLDTAIDYARQIAAGLEAAHEKGIVHRDLKPANIKVTPDGVVKILDFGLAKASETSSAPTANSPTLTIGATVAGTILGTAAYMAPEQARGKSVDKRADIWAFGVVLFEMLTGKPLFGDGDNTTDIIAAVVTREPDWSALPKDTPPHIRRVLERCLRKDPKLRLRDIGEARLAIDEPEAPASAAAPSTAHSGMPLWSVAIPAIVALLLAGLLWRATRPQESPLRPMMRFSAEVGPESTRQTALPVLISADGTRVVFPIRSAEGGPPLLATRLLDQSAITVLTGTEGVRHPFLSADGQWIGFFADGKLMKVSVKGGPAITLCAATRTRGGGGGFWAEDDTILASIDSVNLFRVPVGGGQPVQIGNPQEHGDRTWRYPQILPDGDTVLITASDRGPGEGFDDATIKTYSLKTGQVKTVQQGGYFGRYLPSGHVVYVHEGTLFAVPFDLARLETRGAPVPVLDDVAGEAGMGHGQFDFAQNGTFVYWSGKATNADRPAMWMDRTGNTQPLVAPPGGVRNPRLSPDGKLLAFYNSGDIVVYDTQRDTTSKLTFNGAQNQSPVWMPDGKHVIFASAAGDPAIWWTRADGSGQPQRLLAPKAELFTNSVSPDGRRVAFAQRDPQSGLDLWTLPLDTSDPEHPKPGVPEPFLREEGNQTNPMFSPDGRWIAYCSNQAGIQQVFVRPFAGSSSGASGKWQVSTTGGSNPVWSRDGKALFYRGFTPQIIFKVSYTAAGNSFVPGKAEAWSPKSVWASDTWTFDMSPDGARAVMLPLPDRRDIPAGTVHVTVMLNFFDELKRRVP